MNQFLLEVFREPFHRRLNRPRRRIAERTKRFAFDVVAEVEQQSRVFNDTIFNNISFGRQATLADVEQACRMASIEKDIRALPNGYDTVLSYQGANLSGGQRQRLVLARGLLANPDMLIIDEGTNALDEETKKQVVQRLLEAYRGRLVVFVTHDPLVANEVDVVIDLAAMVGTASASSPQGDVNAICRT